ncbi:Predicted DNA-binding transcriptional regulator YafY, contains an HTH and WYL domains [Pseudonocardia thermophila]|uniref:Predicted DNA-binding transcriptional regulator YafY, contains an HTH and WYL domains n=1 Tax=Pseudonocardia thermophila TaxID=1848 RepID=A0A1M6RRP5_PSETH|nr:WYL domain-containing protein [Pseudonocardia thermophila]SHK35136.1 Predicted DNA-binding transcriptional regulator YafY, contains an HTH and WYL domains [Pseudonocardia thermophila]
MRADRLLAILLLLQHRGRMSAAQLAAELEVSRRTVLRDMDALSAAGVPVYAERGRGGGFALVPGYTTDLTGLTLDEARALLVAGSAPGLGPELASAMRKVVAALPGPQRESATDAASRVLVRTEGWRRRPPADEATDEDVLAAAREAVFAGRRLRIHYTPKDGESGWRTIDPIGLVLARSVWYLLATRDGADRTYRLSRVHAAEVLAEPAERPADVDLEELWRARRDRFLSGPALLARLRVRPERRAEFLAAAWSVREDGDELEVEFGDLAHAAAILWSWLPDVEIRAPDELRAELAQRAAATAAALGADP